jgi:hypothetical protein
MKNRRFLVFLLCLAQVVSAQAYGPEYDENGRLSFLKADLNRDGNINIVDIGLVASAWLDEHCDLSNPCEGADIFPHGGDGIIDFRDFAVTAGDYGRCTDPTNPDCIHVPLTLFEPPSGTAVSFSGSHNGGPSSLPPVGNVDASFDPVVNTPYPGYGGYATGLAGGGELITDVFLGEVNPNPEIEGIPFGTSGEPGGGGSSGDMRNFEMAGNLVLASEPGKAGAISRSYSAGRVAQLIPSPAPLGGFWRRVLWHLWQPGGKAACAIFAGRWRR